MRKHTLNRIRHFSDNLFGAVDRGVHAVHAFRLQVGNLLLQLFDDIRQLAQLCTTAVLHTEELLLHIDGNSSSDHAPLVLCTELQDHAPSPDRYDRHNSNQQHCHTTAPDMALCCWVTRW